MRWIVTIGLSLSCAAGAFAADKVVLEPVWTLTGLAAPESAAIAADGSFLYVSNINGEPDAVDGNGYIARVSTGGKILQEKWATGLNAPKGVVLKGTRLFASDITRLVEIDAKTGKTVAAYDAPGAKFLNDTALSADGRILVSDSGTQRLYVLDGGTMKVLVEDPKLRAVNGMLVEPDRLVIVTMQGLLLAMDWKTNALTQLGDGFGDGDGIAPLGGGRYLVSEWPGQLWSVAADGTKTVLIDSRKEEKLINDFTLVGDMLYVPHLMPGAMTAYRVKR
jgi:DNA-binding beta-propeller fold protein YncE